MLYSMILEESGYVVYAVANGEDALTVASQRLPDVIITEVFVPRLDGLTILRVLGDSPNTGDIPVVVITGVLHGDVPQRARDGGAAVVLSKPASLSVLVEAIADLIRRTPPVQLVRRDLRRTLLTIAKVAAHAKLEKDAQYRVRVLIDRLQVAVLALDDRGRQLAASAGAELLTGYSRADLLAMSIYDLVCDGELPNLPGSTPGVFARDPSHLTIRASGGTVIPVDALVTTIVPGLHAAVFTALSTPDTRLDAGGLQGEGP
jgi:CheY-like chemotaxis protein